jgi:glycosyltransferase involved in cell wall biosynthesis
MVSYKMGSRRIHIFQVAKSIGGVGIYTRRLIKALDKEKFQITVACLAEGSDQMAAEMSEVQGVRAISIPMADQISPVSDIKICLQLLAIIKQNDFNLIHAHTSKPGFFARLAAAGRGIPVIYQPANFAFHDGTSKWQAMIYASLERMAARYLTERIIAVCDGERDLAGRYSVGVDKQFATIYTGIDLGPFSESVDRVSIRDSMGIPSNAPLVGTVARLTEAKSPEDFIRSAAIVHASNPLVHFVWVGSGPLEAESRKLVKSLRLEEVFHFAGYRNNVPEILKTFDCFVLSSHWEGFPLVILEAMAASLPVIATRVMGATEEVCDGETGLLVPIGNTTALAEAVEKVINDPKLAYLLGQAGRLRAETEFPFSKMIARIEELYENVYHNYARN